jgi:cytochrome c-type biogenesis protein CcmE
MLTFDRKTQRIEGTIEVIAVTPDEAIEVGLHYHGIRPDAIRERSRRFWSGEGHD